MDATYHQDRARANFAQYLKVQQKIEKIEADALRAANNSEKLASHMLKTDTETGDLYRRLCGDRSMYMQIAQLSASMAVMLSQSGGGGGLIARGSTQRL